MNVQDNHSLKNLNTFKVDVKAALFAEVGSADDVRRLIAEKYFKNYKSLILGRGSNLLFVTDFEGLVVHNRIKSLLVEEGEEFVYVSAGGGNDWHELVEYCVENGYGGIENLAYIPGSVGAAPVQNIGAYGVELKEIFHNLVAIDLLTGEEVIFDQKSCEFAYRDSVFKNSKKGQYLITTLTLRLRKESVHTVRLDYKELKETFISKGIAKPNIKDVMNAVIEIRKRKLPDPKQIPNGGSFFKNPIVSRTKLAQLRTTYPDIVSYELDPESVKLPAGWLIDHAGWKGYRRGDAGVHQNHALVLVNYGSASGKEIYQLSQEIKTDIQSKFGVLLEEEVNIVGELDR